MTYAVFPHRLDVPNGLWHDMMMLHDSTFRILQMTRLTDIDASLIYGVPFLAKASSDGDLQQYKEMKVLVQQLWKYLVTHQMALVLQMVQGKRQMEESVRSGCLYHSNRQVFLLIAEENGEVTSSSSNGIMYRYANSTDKILYLGSDELTDSSSAAQDMYYDYIVQSLERVQTSSINIFAKNQWPFDHHSLEDNSTRSLEPEVTGCPPQSPFLDDLEDKRNDEVPHQSNARDGLLVEKNHILLENDDDSYSDSDLFDYY